MKSHEEVESHCDVLPTWSLFSVAVLFFVVFGATGMAIVGPFS